MLMQEEAGEVEGVRLKNGQHMEHLTIKWFLCLPEQLPASMRTATYSTHTLHIQYIAAVLHAHIYLSFLMIQQYRYMLFVPGLTCVGIPVSNEHTKVHTRGFLLLVRMDGDVTVQWTICPPSPSSLFCHPSIHHSSLLSSLPLHSIYVRDTVEPKH